MRAVETKFWRCRVSAARTGHYRGRRHFFFSAAAAAFSGFYTLYSDLAAYMHLFAAMDPLTSMAASGLRSRMESLDLLANNVANASTGGYKADREFYSLYIAPEGEAEPSSTMPVIERPWVDLSQGTLQVTGGPLDLALTGKGFFSVAGAHGPLYTRNGSFHLSPNAQLVTSEGYTVTGANGQALTASGTAPIDVAADGSVRQNGILIGQLQVVDFPAAGLVKQGNNYFQPSDPNAAAIPANGTAIEQGKLEASNSGTADSAVRLVGIMRQFEMLQKAVSMGNEMNKQAIEQVAKAGA
jgi:flagellar basal-body rod protein FlgF